MTPLMPSLATATNVYCLLHQLKAMDILQELESYLDDDCMVAFIDLFKADMAAVDAYLAIKCD